jgi:3-deoxy-D-manno-octulosonic acid kinase
VAYGFRGNWLYRCWLVTQAVSGARSLAQVSLQTAAAIPPLLEEVARQVNILVGEGIWHPDLHPGNVLVDDRGRVVLIDFDKVARVGGSRRRLWRRYRRRWRRAVVKHKLPAALAAGLEAAAAALET